MMRWLHLAAVLLAIFVLQDDVSAWVTALAVFVFVTNLLVYLHDLSWDLHDV